MTANLFAIASGVVATVVKVYDDANNRQGASLTEGFKEAVAHQPGVISLSLLHDLSDPSGNHLTSLPANLKPLQVEIVAAVQSGITVVAAAGNGEVAFPAMLPEVLAVGGTHLAAGTLRQVSDLASAFPCAIYPGRFVPDVTGVMGMAADGGNYLLLPTEENSSLNQQQAVGPFPDDTAGNDGWCLASGTSATAPQVAGACALALQKSPTLMPDGLKRLLQRTARPVVAGAANPASNQGTAVKADAGTRGAAGHGLVDVLAVWEQA